MFATRGQENIVHTQQTAAAGKPLNQNIRSLQPKTPGNFKTPFRAQKNDENKPFTFGQKNLQKDGPSKIDQTEYVTPLAPRNRAPLGIKTVNAKAQPLKTPAQGQQTTRKQQNTKRPSTTRKSVKSKIIVAPSEPVHINATANEVDDDEPDFGYAPPPVADLPDPPMDFGYDETFPQFRKENMFRGYGEIFFRSPKDESGMSLRLKREEEEYNKFQEDRMKELTDSIERDNSRSRTDPDQVVEAMIAAGPISQKDTKVTESKVDIFRAKTAAAALSEPTMSLPSCATKQTASSKAKSVISKPMAKIGSSLNQRTARPTPLQVSKNTIGFPKAKKPHSVIPSGQQLRNEHERSTKKNQRDIDPSDFVKLYGEPPIDSEMWYRLQLQQRDRKSLGDEISAIDDLAGDLFEMDIQGFELENDDDDVFQLPMPED